MSFDLLEVSRQTGAPLELYRFRVGPLRPGISVGGGEELIVTDTLEYADLAAMAATGWVFTDTHPFADWVGIDAVVFHTGARSLKAHTDGGFPAELFAARTFGVGLGIEPNTLYRLRTWTRMSWLPWYDADTHVNLIGVGNSLAVYKGNPGEWVRLTTGQVLSDGAGNITARLERVNGWSTVADIHFDQVEIWKQAEAMEDDTDETVFGFTSADVDVVFAGETYQRAIIIRGPFRYADNETRSMEVVIEVPRDHAIVGFCKPAPALPVTCTIHRVHRGDLSDGITPLIAQVTRCEKIGAKARLTLTPAVSFFEKELPVRVTQKKCDHHHYGPVCQASKAGHEFTGLTVNAVQGRDVTVDGAAALAAGFPTRFTVGVLTAPDGSQSSIERFDATPDTGTGDVVRLYKANPAITVGSLVTLLDGCDKTVPTCHLLYGNLVHNGSEPVMPTRNLGSGAGLE